MRAPTWIVFARYGDHTITRRAQAETKGAAMKLVEITLPGSQALRASGPTNTAIDRYQPK